MFSSFRNPRRALRRGGLIALLAVLGLASALEPAAAAAGKDAAAQHAAAVRVVIAGLQRHQWPARSFTSRTSLQVGKRRWTGARAVERWWRAQFRAGLHISLASAVTTHGVRAETILRHSTRTGACAQTCMDRATWQFVGAKIQKMTLLLMRQPSPTGPPAKIPTPPRSPPPGGTPTIPT